MPAGENRGEDLFDDCILADDDLVQLVDHQLAVLFELLEEVVEIAFGFSSHESASNKEKASK
jgi:hypothetical protein